MSHIEVGLQPLVVLCCQLLTPFTQSLQHMAQALLLDVTQQTVEVEVVELQVEVGGHEVGHVCIVVTLIDMEQLVVLGRYDGETVTPQLVAQTTVELLHLHGIHHITHIDTMTLLAGLEVLLLQNLLAGLQLADERLFRLADLDGHLGIGLVVVVAPAVVAVILDIHFLDLFPAYHHQ